MKTTTSTTASTRWPLLMHDQARLEYARLLWRRPGARARLLRHWTDARHPYAPRFQQEHRPYVELLLSSPESEDDRLDAEFRSAGRSLRTVVREIPPVFGSFY